MIFEILKDFHFSSFFIMIETDGRLSLEAFISYRNYHILKSPVDMPGLVTNSIHFYIEVRLIHFVTY